MNGYDVIVVGARCAGASTAMLLARRGYRVLMIDKGSLPGDMPLSTHLLHPPGCAQLARWGLLDALAATGCPPIERYSYRLGDMRLVGAAPSVDGVGVAYCPRRFVLDRLLLDAASAAGVEVRDQCAFVDVLRGGDRVVGVRTRSRTGTVSDQRARLVIGADGMHSSVARAVGAARYNEYEPQQGTYWAYFSGMPQEMVELMAAREQNMGFYVFPTHDDLSVVGVNLAIDLYRPMSPPEIEALFADNVFPVKPELAAARREGKWLTAAVPSFFRQAAGPGWALVGDAGLKKDPVTGHGMQDAFSDAAALAEAADAGLSGRRALDESLADHVRERDARISPSFEFTLRIARIEVPPELHLLIHILASDPGMTDLFFAVIAGAASAEELITNDYVQRYLAMRAVVEADAAASQA